jgi:hypothetical protein
MKSTLTALFLIAILLAAPTLAAAAPQGPTGVLAREAASASSSASLATWLGTLLPAPLLGLLGVTAAGEGDAGPSIDPNGTPVAGDGGASIDPNGLTAVPEVPGAGGES